ncbi:hypothetical protein HOE39_00055 [Candidatus Woesearchaeota archaeon]|nr:hypothetical protein [Candidatus Woesearchaeota archaeon]
MRDKFLDVVRLMKFHKKRDKFSLNFLKNYLSVEYYRKVSRRVKQGKSSVEIKRMGYSFLISGRDLLPRIYSSGKLDKKFNKLVEKEFYAEKYKQFSGNSWLVLPEFIGPNVLVEKRIKSLLALVLFAPDFKLNIIDDSGDVKPLVNFVKSLGSVRAKTSKKTIKRSDLNIIEKNVRLGKFRDIANRAGKKVKIGEGDKLFLKRYIRDARKIKVEISDKLLKEVSSDLIPLVKASAQMELRKEVSLVDVERIRELKL